MRPFRMFFGLAIGIMLFFFLAKIVVIAFIAAAVMSIIYAVFRRLKDFITYDRYGEYYIPRYNNHPRFNNNWNDEVEPLFHGNFSKRRSPVNNVRFIEAI